ncbi:MAG: chorismate synthase [Bacteroidales bacterium]|nr:chorismate synthase [Bacteroidales bacterium]
MNLFGNKFKVELFGESHGPAIGVVIDGVPSGIPINNQDFKEDLQRRAGGKKGGTPRVEEDALEFLSGVYKGLTTGAPLAVIVRNLNRRSEDYDNLKTTPRPGHADFVSTIKHNGFADPRGGGHHSGRITVALVIAGVIARKIIYANNLCKKVTIQSEIVSIGGENSWDKKLDSALERGDSLGGVVECCVKNLPVGIGEPFFDSLESVISHIVFAIPGVRGIEFGDGFKAAKMWGSQHNDPITNKEGETSRNGSGGINGGISNGNPLLFRIAVKPTSSISLPQQTINIKTGAIEQLKIEGRHDTCFALRVPVVLEAATAIALVNLLD